LPAVPFLAQTVFYLLDVEGVRPICDEIKRRVELPINELQPARSSG
jgi:hypothetical protein